MFSSRSKGHRGRKLSARQLPGKQLCFCVWVSETLSGNIYFRRKPALSLKTHGRAKKGVLGEMRRFCLRKQPKAAQLALAASSGAGEQRCSRDGCSSSQSITPVHHDRESIPVVPTGPSAGADPHSLYPRPWSLALARPPAEPPGELWALCTGKGLCPPLGRASWQKNPLHFGVSLGTRGCFREKAESLSMKHPQGESRSPGEGEEAAAFKKDIQGLHINTARGSDRRRRLPKLLGCPDACEPGSIPPGAS